MIDLPTLGRELRARRKALRLSGTELAQRIGVSPTYIWLIEHAKPRTNGEPSRPSEDVLDTWAAALGLDGDETQHVRELAGYLGPAGTPPVFASFPPVSRSRHVYSQEMRTPRYRSSSPPPASQADLRPSSPSDPMTSDMELMSQSPMPSDDLSSTAEVEAEMLGRMRRVLAAAEVSGRQQEAIVLLRSLLRWLYFHVGVDD